MPHHPPDISDARAEAPVGRDRGLDLLRAAALVRVVIWHATGAAAVTVLAAMPVMFFVSGSLFAASAGRRGVVAHRPRPRCAASGRRCGLFAAVAWLLMARRRPGHVAPSLDWSHLLAWLVPFTDPVGSAWEGGWLSSPLWYLRTLLWILLLAPVLAWLVRRAPVALLVAGVVGRRRPRMGRPGPRRGSPAVAPRLAWQAGDVVLFGLFFAFGMWTRSPGRDAGRRARDRGVSPPLVSGAAAVAVWVALPPPAGVVNDSHVVHLVVGATLLFAVLAAAGPIGRLAERPWLRPGVDLLGRRSLTVYLWHTAAIAGGPVAARPASACPADGTGAPRLRAARSSSASGCSPSPPAGSRTSPPVGRRSCWPLTLPSRSRAGSPTGPTAVGWRLPAAVGPGRPGPGRRGGSARRRRPCVRCRTRSPSGPVCPRRRRRCRRSSAVADEPEWWTQPVTIDPVALERTLADWAAENGVPGASVAVTVPDGGSWVGATGVTDVGDERSAATPVDAMSVTKLFTAQPRLPGRRPRAHRPRRPHPAPSTRCPTCPSPGRSPCASCSPTGRGS